MKAVILKCKSGSRFHFGKYAPDGDTALNDSDELMHSDTLFAALVNTYQEIFGDAQELVDCFEKGDISISSLLYCIWHNEKYIWLLPKPLSFNLFEAEDYKSFRKIKFISKAVWEYLQHPLDLLNEELFTHFSKNLFVLAKDELQVTEKDKDTRNEILNKVKLYNISTLPKVRVRGTTEEQGIYQLTVTEIANNEEYVRNLKVHFYFLLDDEKLDKVIATKLTSVIEALAYTGIGAERSTIGEIDSVEIINDWKIHPVISETDWQATVSLFAPVEHDLQKMQYYKTIMRGGRRLGINHLDDKKNVYMNSLMMIAEGAIIHKDCKGKLGDVSPRQNKTYLRNGKPLSLPVRKQWVPEYE